MKIGDKANVYDDPIVGKKFVGVGTLVRRTQTPCSCQIGSFKSEKRKHTEHWVVAIGGTEKIFTIWCDEKCQPVFG